MKLDRWVMETVIVTLAKKFKVLAVQNISV